MKISRFRTPSKLYLHFSRTLIDALLGPSTDANNFLYFMVEKTRSLIVLNASEVIPFPQYSSPTQKPISAKWLFHPVCGVIPMPPTNSPRYSIIFVYRAIRFRSGFYPPLSILFCARIGKSVDKISGYIFVVSKID